MRCQLSCPMAKFKDTSIGCVELCIFFPLPSSSFSAAKEFGLLLCPKVNADQSILEDGRVLSISSVAFDRTLRISSWIFQEPVAGDSLFSCSQFSAHNHNKLSQHNAGKKMHLFFPFF